MNSAAMQNKVTVAEYAVGGHRLDYVATMTRWLIEHGWRVKVLLPPGSLTSPQYIAHLRPLLTTTMSSCLTVQEVSSQISLRTYDGAAWENWISSVLARTPLDSALLLPMADWMLPHVATHLAARRDVHLKLVLMPFTLAAHYEATRRGRLEERIHRNNNALFFLSRQKMDIASVSVVANAIDSFRPGACLCYPAARPVPDLLDISFVCNTWHEDASEALIVGDISARKIPPWIERLWERATRASHCALSLAVVGKRARNVGERRTSVNPDTRSPSRYLSNQDLNETLHGARLVLAPYDGHDSPSGIVSRCVVLGTPVVGWGNELIRTACIASGGAYLQFDRSLSDELTGFLSAIPPYENTSRRAEFSNAGEFMAALGFRVYA